MKNLMEGSKSRLDTTEGMIHELEYRPEENICRPQYNTRR